MRGPGEPGSPSGDSGSPQGRARRATTTVVVLVACGLLVACGDSSATSTLPGRGEGADSAERLFVLMTVVGVAVVVLVAVLLALTGRPRDPHSGRRRFGGRRLIVAGGIVLPVVVIVPLMVLTAAELRSDAAEGPLRVDVVGHRWWWEVSSPDLGIVDANEVHLPVDRDVVVTLASGDVIHSFWIPPLAGKVDMIPGTTNELRLHADETGTFEGICAEYCGLQHARMRFRAVVSSASEFEDWAESRGGTHTVVGEDSPAGLDVFLAQGCQRCHAIQGTTADGVVAPDLTHVGSRQTLAAGTVENTTANMARWIVEPGSIKPGALMPAFGDRIDPADLAVLIEYLEGLE